MKGRRKSVKKMSTRDIAETAKAVRATKDDPAQGDATKAARGLQAALRRAGGRGVTAVARKVAGGYVVDAQVPVAVVDAVLRALK